MSFSIFRIKTVAGANIAGFILGTALFSMFLMLTLYMQQVLGYSPLKTGVAYLAVAGTSIVWAMVASQLVTPRRRQAGARHRDEPAHGRPPVLHAGVGRRLVPRRPPARLPRSSRSGWRSRSSRSRSRRWPASQAKDAGLASGLINTSQQIGGALGIAVLSSVAVAHTTDATKAGDAVPQALTSGFQAAFWVGAGVAAIGVVASLVLIRKEELAAAPAYEPEVEAVLAEAA